MAKNEIFQMPSMELKFAKVQSDFMALENPLAVDLSGEEITISKIEMQIAYKKIVLASDRDKEDAAHLLEVFKENTNKKELEKWRNYFQKKA